MSGRYSYTRLVVGSRLFGYNTEESDWDFLDIYVPTKIEMVANHRITIPQEVTDGGDVKGILLGEFVMGLGTNPENSLVALHYQDEFPSPDLWLRKQLAFRLVEVAEKMANQPFKPKMVATAFRYICAATEICNDGLVRYPLTGEWLGSIKYLLGSNVNNLTYHWEALIEMINTSDLSNDPIDYESMAAWVADIYLEVHHR